MQLRPSRDGTTLYALRSGYATDATGALLIGRAGRFRNALAGLLIVVTAGILTGCVQSPEAQVHSAINDRADFVKGAFAKTLTGHLSIADVFASVQASGVDMVGDIRNWTEAEYDSSTLSYPTSAIYAVSRTDHQVIIRVVFSSSASQGGLAPHELIGYSCVKFTGVAGDPPGVIRASIKCPKIMREKSFDGDNYIAVTL